MRYAAVALLLVVGCEASTPAGRTLTKDEEIVRKHIMANAHNPKSVEFVKWGPHAPAHWPFPTAFVDGVPNRNSRPAKIVRVVFRGNNTNGALVLNDVLYTVQDSKVVAVNANTHGDEYTAVAAEDEKFISTLSKKKAKK